MNQSLGWALGVQQVLLSQQVPILHTPCQVLAAAPLQVPQWWGWLLRRRFVIATVSLIHISQMLGGQGGGRAINLQLSNGVLGYEIHRLTWERLSQWLH